MPIICSKTIKSSHGSTHSRALVRQSCTAVVQLQSMTHDCLQLSKQTDVGPESIIVGTDQRLSRNVCCVMQTHQDQLFFEAVYSALAAIIHEALGSFKTRQQIDVEVCHWLAISALCLKLHHSSCNQCQTGQLPLASCLPEASLVMYGESN